MATPVLMPQMGESIAEGTVSRWLKRVGDTVGRDEPLLEISTDKVDAEIPSPVGGTLTGNALAQVLATLCTTLDANEERIQMLIEAIDERLVMTAPGDWRVLSSLKATAAAAGVPLEIREDRHFFSTVREFADHARGRRSLRMEYFYREQRRRHGVLMRGDEPEGGEWNFDADNRKPPPKDGANHWPEPMCSELDEIDRLLAGG